MEQQTVTREEWLKARKALLEREKALTRLRDEISAARRRLPRVRIDKRYEFDTTEGRQTLADLFGRRSQLLVYHFMMAPGWTEGCKSCSYLADHYDGMLPHLAARDASFVVISRAPLADIEPFRKRMGWKFRWVSSYGSDFNRDYCVSFTEEDIKAGDTFYNYQRREQPTANEAPGASAFYKDDAGTVFHTYSAYARGLDHLVGTYNWLDFAPKGRDEDDLSFSMAWVRHHDRYVEGEIVRPDAVYEAPKLRTA